MHAGLKKNLALYGATSSWTPSQRFAVSRAKIPRSFDFASVLTRTAGAISSAVERLVVRADARRL
jgi:hypothetical protein